MVTCFNGYASGDKFLKTLPWKTVSMRCLNGSILVFTFETKPRVVISFVSFTQLDGVCRV